MPADTAARREISIANITVSRRHRADLGDLRGLSASIAAVGLLHPVVVTPDRELVSGARRLAACKTLGWKKILVATVTSAACARELLVAERTDNICRLEMAPSEKVSLGLAIEEIERPVAKQRQRDGQRAGRQARASGGASGGASGDASEANVRNRTRRVVAAAVGMSGTAYQRARRVVTEAAAGNPVAIEALAEMDRTGKITPAYVKVAGRPTNPPGAHRRRAKTTAQQAIEPLRLYLRGWNDQHLAGTTPAEARRLLAKLEEVERGLFDLHRALEQKTITSRALE